MIWLRSSFMFLLIHSSVTTIVRNPAFYDRQIRQILWRHNFYRELHFAAPLTLDEKLSKESNELAKTMAQVDEPLIIPGVNVFTKKLDRRKSNISSLRTENILTDDINPVEAWYLEEQFYRNEGTKELARNFTQLVWKSSKRLGVGAARSASNTLYIVCKYDPPGNIRDAYKFNVFARKNDNYMNGLENQANSYQAVVDLHEQDLFISQPHLNTNKDASHSASDLSNNSDRLLIRASTHHSDGIFEQDIIMSSRDNSSNSSSQRRQLGKFIKRSVFENIGKTLMNEFNYLLSGDRRVHDMEKRQTSNLFGGNADNELMNDEIGSLLQRNDDVSDFLQGNDMADSLLHQSDNSGSKVHDICCPEEESDPCCDKPPDPCVKKLCSCRRLSPLEILSRKLDMILVFTVFNNIFLIVFGVIVTLGVVIRWCSGPEGDQYRNRR